MKSITHICIYCICFSIIAITINAEEIVWIEAEELSLEGKGWENTAARYARLPESAKEKLINPTAWQMSLDSADIAVHFVTDAKTVHVRWILEGPRLEMPHMPATGASGVDLYAQDDSGQWRFIDNGRPYYLEVNESSFTFPDTIPAERKCMVYFPLYNRTSSLAIGVASGNKLEAAPQRSEANRKPLVIYGTSITQGGCASRPGMAWPTILGRLLNRPVINLGFSGSGSMDPPLGEILAELDAAAFIIDCTWNLGADQDIWNVHVQHLVKALRDKHPQTPIVFIGQSHIHPEVHPTSITQRQEQAVQLLHESGIEGIYLVAGEYLIGNDGEGTVDAVHLNDLGMYRQAQYLYPHIQDILQEATTIQQAQRYKVWVDADTANEIDDGYAILRALVAPEFEVVGLSSMSWRHKPFEEGAKESQQMNEDILRHLDLLDLVAHPIGAYQPMPDPQTPVDSPAARGIIAEALDTPEGEKLHIFVLGAYTNVASALLLAPEILDKVAVYLMGYNFIGGRLQTDEFNCEGDLQAAAFLPQSGVELFVMPASTLREFYWSKESIDTHFKGRGGVYDYLVDRWEFWAPTSSQRRLWDIAVFAAILRPELATQIEIEQDGYSIKLWTHVNREGMQADYWESMV